MMMVCMSEYCHIEPQKYGLPCYCKIFFMLRAVLPAPANKFGHIHLIMCNLGEREPLIKPYNMPNRSRAQRFVILLLLLFMAWFTRCAPSASVKKTYTQPAQFHLQ